ncbi:MAG: hypothetical protein WBL63_11955, partial [Candidatus Acidiferrum sp.]
MDQSLANYDTMSVQSNRPHMIRSAPANGACSSYRIASTISAVAFAIFASAAASAAFAQAAVQEPGAYAFYHPDANVLVPNSPIQREHGSAFAAFPMDDRYIRGDYKRRKRLH